MNRYVFLLLFALCFSSAAVAQINNSDTVNNKIQSIRLNLKKASPLFISIHAGYGMAIGSSYNYFDDNISSITVTKNGSDKPVTNVQYKANDKGLGGGYRVGIGLSYIINDFINIGIEADYYESSISKTRDSSYTFTNGVGSTKSSMYTEAKKNEYRARLLTLSPNIIFKAISTPKFYIYNRIGGVFGIHAIKQKVTKDINEEVTSSNGNQQSNATTTIASYNHVIKMPSLGFTAGLGIQYKISDPVRMFLELQTTHFVLVPTQRTMTSYTVNGEDHISSVNASERYIFYKDAYSSDGTSDPHKPTTTATQKIPITYAGLQLGFSFRF